MAHLFFGYGPYGMTKTILAAIVLPLILSGCGGGSGGSSDTATPTPKPDPKPDPSPVANQAPVIANLVLTDDNAGELQIGDQLTLNYNYSDTDGDREAESVIKWLLNDVAITGAKNNTYVITEADNGGTISAKVTPRAGAGVIEGVEVASNALTVTTNQAPIATNVVILYGEEKTPIADLTTTAWAGVQLTASYQYSDSENDEQNNTQTGYRWLVDGVEVSDAQNYQTVRTDAGKDILLEVVPAAQTGLSLGVAAASEAVQLVARQQTFFTARVEAGTERVLHITDGTEAGTHALVTYSIYDGGISEVVALEPSDSEGIVEKWAFTRPDSFGRAKLWVTDGTPEGTVALLKDHEDNGTLAEVVFEAKYLTAFNGYVYFEGDDFDVSNSPNYNRQNREVWRTDGTVEGTVEVMNMNRFGSALGYQSTPQFTVMGEHLYFVGDSNVNGMSVGNELLRLDKNDNLSLVKDIYPEVAKSSTPKSLTAIKDYIYFTAEAVDPDRDGEKKRNVYVSDGTEAGTHSIYGESANLAVAAHVKHFVEMAGRVYFTTQNTVNGDGSQDGVLYSTLLGSTSVSNHFRHGPETYQSEFKNGVTLISAFDDSLLLAVDQKDTVANARDNILVGVNLDLDSGNDDPSARVFSALTEPEAPLVLEDRIIFAARELPINGKQLFVVTKDNFSAVTVEKITLHEESPSQPDDYLSLNGQIIFVARDGGSYGHELWTSDGTQAGTKLLIDIIPGAVGSAPVLLSGVLK